MGLVLLGLLLVGGVIASLTGVGLVVAGTALGALKLLSLPVRLLLRLLLFPLKAAARLVRWVVPGV